jgi:hypothetical protein
LQQSISRRSQMAQRAGMLIEMRNSVVIAETFNAEQTWRLLWSRAAQQVIAGIPAESGYECIPIGQGWGLCNRDDRRRALVIHPSSNAREIGDLALTVAGAGTRVIPRRNSGYVEYLETVVDIVEDALNPTS